MTAKQKFEACVEIAPNFRIGIEYLDMPSASRFLMWHGRRSGDLNERSGGIVFVEGANFETHFDELLTRALGDLATR